MREWHCSQRLARFAALDKYTAVVGGGLALPGADPVEVALTAETATAMASSLCRELSGGRSA